MATLICWLQMNGSVTGVVHRCGIGFCNVDNANVFEVFVGAGPKLYEYDSIYFEFRILPLKFAEVLSSKAIVSHLDSATICCKIEVL